MTSSSILWHPKTAEQFRRTVERQPHAVMLTGPTGTGKATVAQWLASNMLGIELAKLANYPHYLAVEAEAGKAIGIEAIRELEHFTALKTASHRDTSRVVIIYDAQLLTVEAQNALLKTLEEPPADTVIILTSNTQDGLLPTIQSRVQVIEVLPPPTEELKAALQEIKGADSAKIMALSGGLPGLAFALAEGDTNHPLVAAAETARELLQATSFEKLCKVDAMAKNREATSGVLHILMHMAHASLLTGRASERWQKIQKAAYDCEAALNQGTQPKLALTNLMLNL